MKRDMNLAHERKTREEFEIFFMNNMRFYQVYNQFKSINSAKSMHIQRRRKNDWMARKKPQITLLIIIRKFCIKGTKIP